MNWKTFPIATLVLSFGMVAGAAAQDQNHHDLQRGTDNSRYADRWSDAETPYYRQWYTSTYGQQAYRDYNHLNRDDQRRYWEWRHQHGDQDRHEHDQNDRDRERNDNSPR